MSNLTNFGALTPLQQRVWAARVISAGRDESFFMGENGFIGEGNDDSTKPIHLVKELTKDQKGTRAVLPLLQDLQADGTVDDSQLEGNEEPMAADALEIQLSQLRHGVKSKGKLAEQETVLDFRGSAKKQLAYWLANKIDEIMFLTASGVPYTKKLDGTNRSLASELPSLRFAADVTGPSSQRALYAGTATSTATLTSSDKMSWSLLLKANTLAKRKRITPIRMAGKKYYVVVMSIEQGNDLKNDADYKTIVANGAERGQNNPLFTGAFARVDGLILYEHQKVYSTLGAASGSKWGASGTVNGAQALLLGAQALGYARIGVDEWNESDDTDYKNRVGIAYGCIIGFVKAQFSSNFDLDASGNPTLQDFATISIYTAVTNALPS